MDLAAAVATPAGPWAGAETLSAGPGTPTDTLTWMLLMPDGSVAAVGRQEGSPEELQRVQTRALQDIRRTCGEPAPGSLK